MKQLLWTTSLLMAGACATITAEKEQTVRILTTPEDGASCTVSNGEQTWEVDSTPGEVTVPRAFKKLNVICTKQNAGGTHKADAGTRGRAYGNILLLGVPALVDAATGAGYEYPKEITVPLSPAD